MNAPRNDGTGKGIQQVVGAGAFGRRAVHQLSRKARRNQEPPPQGESRVVASALDLLGLAQWAFSVESPERDLGMDLEDTPSGLRVVAQARVNLANLRDQHEQLLRYLARRLRTGERDPAGLAIVRGRERGPRRDRKYRGLSRAEKGPHRILGRPAARAGALRQADRNVDRNDARRLRRGEHLGKARHDTYAYVAIDGARECHDPASPTAVNTREPSIIQDFSHASREWHRSRSVGRLLRWTALES